MGAARADLYHDTVRQAVAAALPAERRRQAHARIAAALEAEPRPDLGRLVRHLLASGQQERATQHAPRAARRAERGHAYGLAADLYEVALRAPELRAPSARRARLVRARARALERAARNPEAARLWHRLAGEVSGAARLEARLGEAHARLAAGDAVGGHRILDASLQEAGEPPLGQGAWGRAAAGLEFVLGPRLPRRIRIPKRSLTARGASRPDRDVRIGMMVGHFDPLSGVRFLQRAREGFLALGAREPAAHCDYLFAYFALFGSRRPGPVILADRYEGRARRVLGDRPPEGVVLQVMPDVLRASRLQRAGRFVEASALLEPVVDRLVAEGYQGSYETMRVLYQRAACAMYRQDLPDVDRWLRRWRLSGPDAADLALFSNLTLLEMMRLVYGGALEEARRLVRERAYIHPPDHPTLQQVGYQLMSELPELYLTDCRAARQGLLRAWRRGRRYRIDDTVLTGVYSQTVAMAEALALRGGDPAASPLRVKAFLALARDSTPANPGWLHRAEAYLADALQLPQQALGHLVQAERAAADFEQPLDVAVARYQQGLRIGGDRGRALLEQARQAAHGAGGSERFLQEDVALR